VFMYNTTFFFERRIWWRFIYFVTNESSVLETS
jgi:hypothetical protein